MRDQTTIKGTPPMKGTINMIDTQAMKNGNSSLTTRFVIPILGLFAAVIGVISSWVFAISRDQSGMSNRVTKNEVKVEVFKEICEKFDERFEKMDAKLDKVIEKLNTADRY